MAKEVILEQLMNLLVLLLKSEIEKARLIFDTKTYLASVPNLSWDPVNFLKFYTQGLLS